MRFNHVSAGNVNEIINIKFKVLLTIILTSALTVPICNIYVNVESVERHSEKTNTFSENGFMADITLLKDRAGVTTFLTMT